jgi:hypothetical protein
MKKTIIAILALTILLPLFAFSQGVYDEEEVTPALYIGPYFGWTLAGINASEVPNGTKNIVSTAPTPNFGIFGYYPLNYTQNSGIGGMVGFKQVPYGLDFSGNKVHYNFKYFLIGAFFNISGFTIGLDANIPVSGNNVTSDTELPSDNLATTVDFKLGGFFKVQESKMGSLNVFLNAGYFLIDQYINSGTNSVKPAHIQAGITYLFNTNEF